MNSYVTPTIVLPGINPAEITERFNRGEYVNMVIPKLDTQIVAPGSIGIRTNYSGSIHDPSFIVHGKSGIETVYHTTNAENYSKEHNLPINPIDVIDSSELECMWCGGKVGPEYLRMPTHTEYTMSDDDEFVIEVYGEGCYCGGRCCLADILEKGKGIDRHEMDYQNSEVVLRMIHYLKYPTEPTLEPAPPRRFLRKHGGPLTREQFLTKIYSYTNTPNIHFLNSKCIIKQENCLNGVAFNGSILPSNKILNISRPILNQPKAVLPSIGPGLGLAPGPQAPNIPGLSIAGPNIPMQHPVTIRDQKKSRNILAFM